jgi:2-polyprenyl-3-methyl-5-hydroxy-6-metoxy-1,4-benzoquinol methylase
MLSENGKDIGTACLSNPLIEREAWILKRCAGKRVLHLGCTDAPATAEKGDCGILLHQQLARCTASLTGVDINGEGLDILRRKYGFDNLHLHDVEELETLRLPKPIDVIVAGEVLEHLNNVGRFFEGCKTLLNLNGASLLVTVPNSPSIKRIFAAIIHRSESVHPDHTCYFSPSTLSEAARRHGMRTVEMRMFMWRSSSLESKIGVALCKTMIRLLRAPLLADGVAAEFTTGNAN